jgi:hypothetical protein
MKVDLQSLRFEATRQIAKERFDAAVQIEVQRLKTKQPWWHTVFPFVITIRKRK